MLLQDLGQRSAGARQVRPRTCRRTPEALPPDPYQPRHVQTRFHPSVGTDAMLVIFGTDV